MAGTIERISDAHDFRRFRCGEHVLDHFLRRYALDNDRRGLGSTYVAIDDAAGTVLGYVTLCTTSIHFEHVPKDALPHYPVPAVLIARLGVDRRAQGRGIGAGLILHALRLAVGVAETMGVYAVVLDAMSDRAAAFYRKHFGFSELLDSPYHLFVTVADLRASGIEPTSA